MLCLGTGRTAHREVRLDVRVVDGNTPTHLAGAVDRRVVPRPRSDLPHPVADGGEVHVRGGCVPPARDAEAGVEVLDAGPWQQGAPDGGACEFDLVGWPGCVADYLQAIVKGGVGGGGGVLRGDLRSGCHLHLLRDLPLPKSRL